MIDREIVEILKKQGITKLYPPQEKALPLALEGKNLVLSMPTASGKSLIAYITIFHHLRRNNGKALYIVPLRALAREKYDDLRCFEELGFRVALSVGDLDEADKYLSDYDIIVCTSEKADSLLRHGTPWLSHVKVLVVDEIHLINDSSRGPTLEVIIARFKALNPTVQVLALSATIQNADEISEWLNAELVCSDWRPVILKEGVWYNDKIIFNDGTTRIVNTDFDDAIESLVYDSIMDEGQILIFVNTRRSAVSLSRQLSQIIKTRLSAKDLKELKRISRSIADNESEITSVDTMLASCIECGCAFHHAGLDNNQRRVIEQGFKDHYIKCIVATPTLAAGINIPARRVIIRDLWRYDMNLGVQPIPILEYKQQAGRAGRPRYDKIGEAITIAKTPEQRDFIFNNYIMGSSEKIYSKLGSLPALRMHLLSAIATGFASNKNGIKSFISSTFFAYQTEIESLEDEIESTLVFLKDNDFIYEDDEGYKPTLFGNRTSSLYIDPLSAVIIRRAIEKNRISNASSLAYLHVVCSTPDIQPLYLRKVDKWVEEKAEEYKSSFICAPPDPCSEDYDWFLSSLKTACLLEDWINEVPEDRIISIYDIGPGDIHSLVEKAEWLVYAMREFSRMYNFSLVHELTDLIMRVHYGCKEELLNLISLRGIGRVRARALYKEGFRTVNDLRSVPIERLASIRNIGKVTAISIKKQLNEEDGKTRGLTIKVKKSTRR
ncbi:MAG: DEAD/DEAH box helicase [Candidatus Thermoplasmatota archaeon]